MHEGKKIRELVESAGMNLSEFARKVDLTRPAVDKWVAVETLGPKAWESASKALARVGIDPNHVRPVAVTFHRERPAGDLLPLLRGFSRQQLAAVLQLLNAGDKERDILRAVVADRLDRGSEH